MSEPSERTSKPGAHTEGTDGHGGGLAARWRAAYGAAPLHLLGLLACFALAGYAAVQATEGPKTLQIAIWFLAAVIAHDLVLFPVYALADRSTRSLLGRLPEPLRLRGRVSAQPADINYLRVPALLSGLLLFLFSSLILQRSETAYRAASGLDQSPYLGRWLLLTGIAFATSALLFAASLAHRAHRAHRTGAPAHRKGT